MVYSRRKGQQAQVRGYVSKLGSYREDRTVAQDALWIAAADARRARRAKRGW